MARWTVLSNCCRCLELWIRNPNRRAERGFASRGGVGAGLVRKRARGAARHRYHMRNDLARRFLLLILLSFFSCYSIYRSPRTLGTDTPQRPGKRTARVCMPSPP